MFSQASQTLNQSLVRQLIVPRITQDQIIIEDKQTLSTIQSVICPVCLCVLSLPHWSCDKCENVFCKECMQDWWKKYQKICIFKCEDAQFKMVKRSNTYNALMQILKVRCNSCEAAVSISSITSHDKICPKKLIQCTCQGCRQIIMRCELQQHVKNCSFRKQLCEYCQQMFIVGVIVDHKNKQCPQKVIKCENQGCQISLKRKRFDAHQKDCQFLKISCEWCLKAFSKKDIQAHTIECNFRQFKCQWCHQKFKNRQYKEHKDNCIQRRVNCALCKESIRQLQYKDHKNQCMFKQVVQFKQSQQMLIIQNTNLKQRVHQLEQALNQISRNRHQATLKSLMHLKEAQKRQFQRDLLRIKNSLQSIRKLRTQQLNEHQKKIHLSTSLCVICNTIRKKLEDQTDPLIKMQEDCVAKIREIQRMETAVRKSVIRAASEE